GVTGRRRGSHRTARTGGRLAGAAAARDRSRDAGEPRPGGRRQPHRGRRWPGQHRDGRRAAAAERGGALGPGGRAVRDRVARLRQAYEPNEQRPLGGCLAAMGTYAGAALARGIAAKTTGRRAPDRPSTPDVVLLSVATHELSRLLSKDAVTS